MVSGGSNHATYEKRAELDHHHHNEYISKHESPSRTVASPARTVFPGRNPRELYLGDNLSTSL